MGKRGPKLQFFDVVCPNKNCKLYGLINQGNITGECKNTPARKAGIVGPIWTLKELLTFRCFKTSIE